MTINKTLLHNVIDSLPPDELKIVYRMFSGFIEDYLDSILTEQEREEHLKALEDVRLGNYVLLADLPD